MEDKSTGRANGERRRRPPEGTMGAGGDIRNTKKKKMENMKEAPKEDSKVKIGRSNFWEEQKLGRYFSR